MDIVNHGSSLPVQYMNATNASYTFTGPGMLTPFGMRQMHIRGREIRRRYITQNDIQYLSPVSNPKEYFAYAIDTDRNYQSAQSFMTGLYPAGDLGPALLLENQTVIAKPPLTVERFTEINQTL